MLTIELISAFQTHTFKEPLTSSWVIPRLSDSLLHHFHGKQNIATDLSLFWQFRAISDLPPGRRPQRGPPHCYVHAQWGCDGDVGTEPPLLPCCSTDHSRPPGTNSFRDGRPPHGLVLAGQHSGGGAVRGGLGVVHQVYPELQAECDCETGAGTGAEIPRNTLSSTKDWCKPSGGGTRTDKPTEKGGGVVAVTLLRLQRHDTYPAVNQRQ